MKKKYDIILLAFKELMREGNAKIVNGQPIYKGGELLDRMITVRDYVIAHREEKE